MLRRLSLLLLPSLFLANPAAPEIVERVVAKVNGDIVTLSEFEARQIAAVQGARVPPAEVESFLRDQNARILQEAIDDALIMQRATELGLRLRSDYMDEVVANIKKENNIQSDAELTTQLRREGMTIADLRRSVERSITRRQLLAREVESKVTVTEAEARADYDANRASFVQPAGVHLQEILVTGDGAQEKARELARRARAGEDFAVLARASSASPSKAAGGDLGVVPPSDLAPSIAAAAELLAPGGISDPISTTEGWRVVKLIKRREAGEVPFEEARADIQKRLGQARLGDAYDAYLVELRKGAAIDVRVREVPLQIDPAAANAPAAVVPLDTGGEFAVTPQAKPERVVPPPVPQASPVPGAGEGRRTP